MTEISDALKLWDLVREGDTKTLAKHIEWKGSGVSAIWPRPCRAWRIWECGAWWTVGVGLMRRARAIRA